MVLHPEEDMVITERAALVAWRLAHGEAMTTADAAEMVGVCERSAQRMMCKIARILPIVQRNGHWEAAFFGETENS
jgi:hypothetical protein